MLASQPPNSSQLRARIQMDHPLPDGADCDGDGRVDLWRPADVNRETTNTLELLPYLFIGWANLHWPGSTTTTSFEPTGDIYGQVWIDGHTDQPGQTEELMAQVGYGPDGSDPDGNPDWTWVDAEFNVDVGNNDEFKGQLVPEGAGTYDYAYRFSATGGCTWLYADLDGTGNGYDPAQAGDLTVFNP